MTANELRIGNYVRRKSTGEEFGVDVMNIAFIESDNKGPFEKSFEPIELTPEWLERLGFENKSTDGCWIYNKPIEYGQRLCVAGLKKNKGFSLNELHRPDEDGEFKHYDIVTVPEIQYIHTLQNLYFSLTSKELTLDKSN